jgi:phage terminase large subunit-like protein
VRLVAHRVFQPAPNEPLDFEETIERTLLDLDRRFAIRKVLFDPYQLVSVAQRLLKRRVKVEEFPQSSPNLTTASQNLYELIQDQRLIVYPDADMRRAISQAVAVETPRGWRISKVTQSHKIDLVVALAMAALASLTSQNEPAPAKLFWDVMSGSLPDQPELETPRPRIPKTMTPEEYARWSAPVCLMAREFREEEERRLRAVQNGNKMA